MRTARQIFLLAAKDLRLFVMDKGALAFALAFPLLFAVAFSFILPDADLDDTLELHVATGEGDSGVSHALIEQLQQIPDIEIVQLAPEDAVRQADDGDIVGYLLFPEGLTERLFSGEQANIQVVSDADNPQGAAFLYEIAYSISRQLSVTREAVSSAVELAVANGQMPDEAQVSAAVAALLEDPGTEAGQVAGVRIEQVGDIEPVQAASYVLPGYITMFLFFAAGFGAAEFIRERRQQTFDRMIASGVSPTTILAGKWVGTAARALVQAVVLWTAGVLFFGIDMGREPIATVLVTLGMLVASASFTLFLATIARTENAAESITVLAALTLAALGGSWWPLFIMPEWMQTVAKITPHAWTNEAFNTLLLFGGTFSQVAVNLLALVAFAVAFALFAALRLNTGDA